MERHEFDLNEYSLEVKDGKAVLERKIKEFKPGDVLEDGDEAVVIYAGTKKDGAIITYAGYGEGNFTSRKDTGWGYTKDFRYATEEQTKMLFAEIEKRGYVWDAEKLELRKKEFEDGAFLVDEFGNIFIHSSKGDSENLHGAYLCWNRGEDMIDFDILKNITGVTRLATEEDETFLLKRLSEEGYIWDSEKKMYMKKRWRAKMGEVYYAVCVSHAVYVLDYIEGGVSFDDRCFETCNYFRTKEQAEKVAEEVRKVFEKYKEEQK